MKTPNSILDQARKIARSTTSWADFANALFDPISGLITTACPTRVERDVPADRAVQTNPATSEQCNRPLRIG